jgi:hypothetical protein
MRLILRDLFPKIKLVVKINKAVKMTIGAKYKKAINSPNNSKNSHRANLKLMTN